MLLSTCWAVLAYIYLFCAVCQAQVLQNGQVFTNGLAIFDAPAPDSTLHAGSSMSIAIDVSGNGQLSRPSFSTAGFDSLNIYLVSTEANLNLTITNGTQFLLQEQGSTVKHLNWPIPTCIQPGPYNITLYESSHLAGSQFFSITPVPVSIENNAPSGACSSTNQLFAEPQASAPLPANPFLNANALSQSVALFAPQQTASSSSVASSIAAPTPQAMTVTVGTAGAQWPMTVIPSGGYAPVVLEPSGYNPTAAVTVTGVIASASASSGGGDSGTVTVVVTPTFAPTPVTVVLVSMDTETVTTTVSGDVLVFTTTAAVSSTTLAYMGMDSHLNGTNYAGFLPINADSSASTNRSSLTLLLVASISGLVLCIVTGS
ncbi:hypothetical protein PsYK624_020970 [Phanerochaete sordida]|uniref:Uncharacterized protein n=1 Tax=Phanerochaete sordida TaxID=48140 RepID=A0A9P3FZB6_9APHY|nr:hypothetical protein PsYK624_020970 [Phanerochaete sordida]